MVCWAIFSRLYSINAQRGEILHRESNFFWDFFWGGVGRYKSL